MPKFNIPKEDWKAFVSLLLIKPEKKKEFLEIIKDPTNVPHADDFAKHLTSATGIDRKESDKIVEVLFKLYNMYDTSEKDIDSNISLLIDSLKEIDKKEIKEAQHSDIELFGLFIKALLSLHDTLGVRAKAYRLMPQHQNIFLHSDIYSDIRSIFRRDNPEVKPSAAVIVHLLKIDYYEDYKKKAFYFGLSANDLYQLKNTVERAIKKHECLKTMIAGFGIQCLEEEE